MTDPDISRGRQSVVWRSLAGTGCALAGVLAFELVCLLTGFRPITPAGVPILAVLLAGLLWGLPGGLAAGAVVAASVLVALGQPGRFTGLEQPVIVLLSLTLPVLVGALTGGVRDYLTRLNTRMLAIVEERLVRVEGERARREEALRASESRFKSLTDLSSDWYWEQDEHLRFVALGVDANNQPTTRSGTFVGKTRWDNSSASLTEEQWEAHRAVLDARAPFQDLEYSRLGVDGERRWVSIGGTPIFDASGRFQGYRGIGRDITARKRIEEALRESEARFRSLTEMSSDAYWEQDDQYRFTLVSDGALADRTEGTSRFLGKTRWELPSIRPAGGDWEEHKACLEARLPFRDRIHERILPGGSSQLISVSGVPLFHPDGRFKGYRGTATNVTQRKRAEVLRELEHTISRCLATSEGPSDALRSVIRTMCEMQDWAAGRYWRLDGKADVLHAAEFWGRAESATEKHLAATCGSMLGRGVGLAGHVLATGQPLWIVDALGDSRLNMRGFARDVGAHGVFLFPVNSDGKTIGVLAFSSTQVREPDKPLLAAVLVIGSQVGQFLRRKQAEEELRRFRVALDNSADLILLIDRATMRYVDMNDTANRLLGYTREELLELGPQDLLPESRENLEKAYDRLIASPEISGSLRSYYRCKDGSTLPFESSRHVIRSGNGYLIAAISRDVRERMAAEAAARDASARIERLNAELEGRVVGRTAELEGLVRELESFSYTISHDLRAPLRAMSGFAEILLQSRDAEMPADAKRMLGRIRANARRMSELLDGLLAFARLGRRSIAKTAAPMRALAVQSWAELAVELDGRRVEMDMGDLPDCDGDPVLLKQVWANLLSNAIKYTRGCNPTRISVGWDAAERAYFVRDNGAGFDMRYADKLFGVFSRLHSDDEFEGTGLGLAICERILHRHGGRIRAEGVPGKGATFYFSV